jgi:hypothetical protein
VEFLGNFIAFLLIDRGQKERHFCGIGSCNIQRTHQQLEQAYPTFVAMLTPWTEFGLYAGNLKFST